MKKASRKGTHKRVKTKTRRMARAIHTCVAQTKTQKPKSALDISYCVIDTIIPIFASITIASAMFARTAWSCNVQLHRSTRRTTGGQASNPLLNGARRWQPERRARVARSLRAVRPQDARRLARARDARRPARARARSRRASAAVSHARRRSPAAVRKKKKAGRSPAFFI